MVSHGLKPVVIVAISLLVRFDQGTALMCRVCSSQTNENCLENASDVDLKDCDVEPLDRVFDVISDGKIYQKTCRFRRDSIYTLNPDYICYTLVYEFSNETVVERGCYSYEDACEWLRDPKDKSSAACYTCEHDDCNGSPNIGIGFSFVLVCAILGFLFS